MNDKNFQQIGRRIEEERDSLGFSKVAFSEACGVNRGTLATWEKGEQTPTAAVLSVMAALGVDASYVITGRRTAGSLTGPAPAPQGGADALHVPLFSARASMGAGADVLDADVVVGDVPVSRGWLAAHLPRARPEALRLVHAHGDSMAGTLESGDFALVDTDCTVPDVDGVYVLQAGGQLFIKRVTRRMDGTHEVTSDNPSVRTVDVLDGGTDVAVCGRVVYGWNGRRL